MGLIVSYESKQQNVSLFWAISCYPRIYVSTVLSAWPVQDIRWWYTFYDQKNVGSRWIMRKLKLYFRDFRELLTEIQQWRELTVNNLNYDFGNCKANGEHTRSLTTTNKIL